MLQFKKPISLVILPYKRRQMKLYFFILYNNCLSTFHFGTIFLILFSFVTYINSNTGYAAEDHGKESTHRKRSRSSAPVDSVNEHTTGDAASRSLPPTPEAQGDEAESRVTSGDEPQTKKGRASGSTALAATAPPAPALNAQIVGIFDLNSLDAEPKRDLVRRCLAEISGNRVGELLLRVLGEQLGEYHRLIQAYSKAITQLKSHATDAFFANLNKQRAEMPEVPTARGGTAARGRAGRKSSTQDRLKIKIDSLQQLIGDQVTAAFTRFLANPAETVSMISADETCFNYTVAIPLLQSPGNLRVGNLRIHLDFKKVHFLGGQPSSLTSCLGAIEGDKIAVGVHYAPYYLTIAHELIHAKHFLQSVGADIEYAIRGVQHICTACAEKGSTIELRDVFPDAARETPKVPLEHMSYLRALSLTGYDARVVADIDFKIMTQEDELHEQFLPEADRQRGGKYPLLWNNLEERRTVVGPDRDGISELTLRLAADIPMRYLYQEADRHLFEDPEIINVILARNKSEQIGRIFERPIILGQVLEVSEKHAATFIFKRYYALA